MIFLNLAGEFRGSEYLNSFYIEVKPLNNKINTFK